MQVRDFSAVFVTKVTDTYKTTHAKLFAQGVSRVQHVCLMKISITRCTNVARVTGCSIVKIVTVNIKKKGNPEVGKRRCVEVCVKLLNLAQNV